MDPKTSAFTLPAKVFTDAEYQADAGKVIDHAAATGRAVVAGPDGSPRFTIAIPPADPTSTDSLD